MFGQIRNVVATIALLLFAAASASASERVNSERSLTPQQPALHWRLRTDSAPLAAKVGYPEISIQRIHAVSQKNMAGGTQIGIGRFASREGSAESPSTLRWIRLRNGGSVTRVEYTSPLALAMRVGLRVAHLRSGVEFRFAGSDRREDVVASMGVAQMRRLADRNGVFWTPSTDGQSQIIEIYRPANVPESGALPQAPAISHLLGNSRNNFILAKSLGQADFCQLDTACKVPTLGQDFVNAVASTVRIQFVLPETGNVTGCTATLVADKVAGSQIPYLISGGPCTGIQRAEGSVNSFWGFEATSCNSGVARPPTQLTGGVTELTSPNDLVAVPGTLLRLNEPAPAGSVFSGWDTGAMVLDQPVISIHHPNGDVKKVASGLYLGSSDYKHGVTWVGGGYMDALSGGAGLFTADADGYHLRGYSVPGGSKACGDTYLPHAVNNNDSYGRMDVLYVAVRPWLAPDDPEPVPDFDYVFNGRTVTFTARTVYTMYDYAWSIDGQAVLGGKTMVNTFATPGFYTVRLSVAVNNKPRQYVTHIVPIEQNVRVNGSSPRIPGRQR